MRSDLTRCELVGCLVGCGYSSVCLAYVPDAELRELLDAEHRKDAVLDVLYADEMLRIVDE